jgi:hypothetical protein
MTIHMTSNTCWKHYISRPLALVSEARSDVFPACSKFHCYQLGVLPFPVVRAFIRLGRKYDFEDFFDSAVASLGSDYPTSIEAYDAEPPQTRIEWYSALHLDIINLATENNIWSALHVRITLSWDDSAW